MTKFFVKRKLFHIRFTKTAGKSCATGNAAILNIRNCSVSSTATCRFLFLSMHPGTINHK